MQYPSFCWLCRQLLDYKEDWVAIKDEGLLFYHWACYLKARKDGHMPKPDYVHKKGDKNEVLDSLSDD